MGEAWFNYPNIPLTTEPYKTIVGVFQQTAPSGVSKRGLIKDIEEVHPLPTATIEA